jgi:hypothetical protein
MARVKVDGLSGVIGDMVYYIMDGKQYARQKPGKRNKKRNKPENPQTTLFGMISKHGSRMLSRMKTSFLFKFKRDTYNAARGWMRDQYAANNSNEEWKLSMKNSGMCKLNPEVDLRDFLKAEITVNDLGGGKIGVFIDKMNPVKNIKAPARTNEVNIRVVAATSGFGGKGSVAPLVYCEQYTFPYQNAFLPSKDIVLHTKGETGDIAVVAIAVEYKILDSWSKENRHLPTAIVAMGRLVE